MIFPVVINTIIFLSLSLIHFYWAFGGKLWIDEVLPSNSSGTKMLNPSMSATFIVAFGLMFLAFVTAGNQGFLDNYIKRNYFRYGSLIIAVIFLLRAIGDFKFVGFFKTITETRFAINDAQIFSPLCLLIALSSFSIFILNKSKS
jgi:Protein of unknown function (DUF3995)